jgi:alkanesulfonate monooxygenase SsuD/methylene tetrahydromethanopterin reductase-like flavin-dependent oxidoreductase (luciferase family)
MHFNLHLSMDHHHKSYGGRRLFAEMLEQAVLADRLGYRSVSVTEHHLLELGLMPSPLMAAVKIAAHTRDVEILTAVAVLPLRDMRIFAGEVVTADIFTDGRLVLGVGRGAYRYEMERLGVPMEETRERFDESLAVLQALLTREEVSWRGKYYTFDALTVMPRPHRPGGPPMMMAVLAPEAIYHCTKRGFHILTNPLTGDAAHFRSQVDAFRRARAEMGEAGRHLTLTVSRAAFPTTSEAQRRRLLDLAQDHYARFDNVFTGPGLVDAGIARALPRRQTVEELGRNLLVCPAEEMVDRLSEYADLGVDRVSLMLNFGAEQSETLEAIQRIAEEVMPHLVATAARPVALTA